MNEIKALRIKYDLTQAQLAQICGITIRTITRWETENKAPKKAILLVKGALLK